MLDRLGKYITFIPGSVGPPDIYLREVLFQVRLPNGVSDWSIIVRQYIQEAVNNVEEHLKKNEMSLKEGKN